jgi:ribosomal protein S18 acetylase RimI-like enzyme
MTVRLDAAVAAADIDEVRTLFREYADSLGVDLEYQGFEEELRGLPGDYAPPSGMLLLARDADTPAGCVAVRRIDDRIAEMKRLFVRPAARGSGLGRVLTEAAMTFCVGRGYERLRLDTLPQMARAQELYRQLGFAEIEPYRFSPVAGTVFMEKTFKEADA